jgi:hypothetical protein
MQELLNSLPDPRLSITHQDQLRHFVGEFVLVFSSDPHWTEDLRVVIARVYMEKICWVELDTMVPVAGYHDHTLRVVSKATRREHPKLRMRRIEEEELAAMKLVFDEKEHKFTIPDSMPLWIHLLSKY